MTDPAAGPAPGPVTGPPGAGPPRFRMGVAPAYEQYARGGGPGAHGDHEVHVIVEIRAEGLDAAVPRRPPQRSEVIIIDCSGSMAHPTLRKIAAARKAAAAAIERLPDGTHFALVAGTDTARLVYPPPGPAGPGTVAASPASRADGSRTALTLDVHGGTRISAWLSLARRLLTARPGATFRHALLLTDGRDEHGRAEELRRVLDDCAGEFTCDALGIGADWDAAQLQQIADRLHGRAEAVVEEGAEGFEDQLTRVFGELIGASTRRTLPQLTLGVRTEPYLEITLFRQVNPTVLDLTDTAVHDGDRTCFPTGAWGDETRWYELRMRVDPDHPDHPAHREPHTARIASLRLEAEGSGDVVLPREEPVTVHWTQEYPPLTDPGVHGRHFQRHAELQEASWAGSTALYRDDIPAAERELGKAVRLAHELGATAHLKQLRKLVIVENAALGRVRVRDVITPEDVNVVGIMSGHTTPPPSALGGDAGPAEGTTHSDDRPARCSRCREWVRPGRFCENCGHPLGEGR